MRRTKQKAQELLRTKGNFTPQNIRINIIPPKAKIEKNGRIRVVPISTPKYVSITDLPSESNHPFVEIGSVETLAWLQSFSDSILTSEKDTRYPLMNPEFDFHNPEISGFRIYVNNLGCSHIQVSRVPNSSSLFQLDYFEISKKVVSGFSKKYLHTFKKFKAKKRWSEKKTPKVLMIVIVDISEKDFNSINLIYASSDLVLVDENMSKPESDLEYARRAALIFRHIQVYMRTWDFETSNSSRFEITPLEVFGRKIEL